MVGIEAEADRDTVEDQRGLVVDAAQQDRAAAEAELPVVGGAVRRLEMGQKRQAVRAREDLERSDQYPPVRIPLDVDLGRVDRHRIIWRVGVDDVARADRDLAAEEGRHAVAAELTLELAGQRQVGGVGEVLHPERQQDVGGGNLIGADVDRTHTVLGGADRGAQRPRARALLAEAERDAATARPAQAERDVLKAPFAAALLIVDDQIAVLQTDLVEVLAVEPGHAQTVEPVEALKNATRGSGLGSGLGCVRTCRSGSEWRRRNTVARECRREARFLLGGDAGRQRLGGVAGGHGDGAVGRNADRQLGVHEIEALGAQVPHQETRPRQLHFGLRCGGDDGVIVVADDDVADAHGDADPPGPLDLSAADLHSVAVADIVLDGGSEPRRRDVEVDGTGTEPPPQRAETADENDGEGSGHDGQPLQPATGGQPAAQ